MTEDQSSKEQRLQKALKLITSLDNTGALEEANAVLNMDQKDPLALFVAGQALQRAQRWGLAYNIFLRCAQLNPDRHEPWNMMGICLQAMWKIEEAEKCLKKCLELDPDNTVAMQNIGLLYINRCMPDEALKWINRAEKSGDKTPDNLDNKALAMLMKRDWGGWVYHRMTSGQTKQRPLRAYCDPEEPMWNGEPGTVVVYTNQGIGDEIAYASCIPDAMKVADIIVDCDERVAPLFKRSFGCKVYGNRFGVERDWDHPIDYSIPIDCLAGLFRKKTEDFPGTPYLKADPERQLQWKALFDTYRRPVIGIAWNGGTKITGSEKRSLPLEALLPLFKSFDATWVSLEYRDQRQKLAEFEMETGVKILDFPRAVHAVDYDETAALVAECDLVITVTTAVVHLAGALGKETWCLAPNRPRWWYGLEGDLPWYKSVKMFRQEKDGRWPINELVKCLQKRAFS